MPTEHRPNLMIRTTIIALNKTNVTGNNSVLRDLAAPFLPAGQLPTYRLREFILMLQMYDLRIIFELVGLTLPLVNDAPHRHLT